jgi:23S rRNA pseudouridine1911/1915/1917 synthase
MGPTGEIDQQPVEFAVQSPMRLDVAVSSALQWSRGKAQYLIRDGAVYVAGLRVREPGVHVVEGQQVRVQPQAPAERRDIDAGKIVTIYRDAHLWIVNKPAGLPTQPPPRGGDALNLRLQRELGPHTYLGEIHRLDRDASGLVVYALDRETAADLAEQFRSHRARRRYLAVARTGRAPGVMDIDEPVDEIEPGRMALTATGMPAHTWVNPLAYDAKRQLSLLELALDTGRTHQIRLHVAWAIGPLLGDRLYGDPTGPHRGRIALHAAALGLIEPATGQPRRYYCPPPAEFWPEDHDFGDNDWGAVVGNRGGDRPPAPVDVAAPDATTPDGTTPDGTTPDATTPDGPTGV